MSPHCTAVPVVVPGHCMLAYHVKCMYTVWYGIVPTLRHDSQNFMLKSSNVRGTVQCALKVVATREECGAAMAEWVMFLWGAMGRRWHLKC